MRIAELEAEAMKARAQVKMAEGEARVKVLRAKERIGRDAVHSATQTEAEIEQSRRLEAQARKEAAIQNAEGEGAG